MTDVRIPVIMAAARTPVRGGGGALRRWAADLCTAASASPGYVRSRIDRGSGSVTVWLVFADAASAMEWERSPYRADLLARADDMTSAGPRMPAIRPRPPRWRTALVVWLGLIPFALAFAATLGPWVATLPAMLQPFATTVVLVPLAVYIGIPAVNSLVERRS